MEASRRINDALTYGLYRARRDPERWERTFTQAARLYGALESLALRAETEQMRPPRARLPMDLAEMLAPLAEWLRGYPAAFQLEKAVQRVARGGGEEAAHWYRAQREACEELAQTANVEEEFVSELAYHRKPLSPRPVAWFGLSRYENPGGGAVEIILHGYAYNPLMHLWKALVPREDRESRLIFGELMLLVSLSAYIGHTRLKGTHITFESPHRDVTPYMRATLIEGYSFNEDPQRQLTLRLARDPAILTLWRAWVSPHALNACVWCKKSPKEPQVCSQCHKVAYCGKDCQKAHWEKGDHGEKCKNGM